MFYSLSLIHLSPALVHFSAVCWNNSVYKSRIWENSYPNLCRTLSFYPYICCPEARKGEVAGSSGFGSFVVLRVADTLEMLPFYSRPVLMNCRTWELIPLFSNICLTWVHVVTIDFWKHFISILKIPIKH